MRVLFLTLLALLAGCSYSPDYASVETCQLHCGDKGECPNGFSCSEGYCVRPGEAGAACFGGEETEGTVWLCQGVSLSLKTRSGAAQSTTTWQASPDAKLPEGVSVADDKLVIKSNAKLEYGVQKVTVRATDGSVTKDIDVALDVKRCLEVPELVAPSKVCRGESLNIPLKSEGGASEPSWNIQSLSAQGEDGKRLESVPLRIEKSASGLTALVGDGLAVGSYEVVLEVSSTSNASWAGDYTEEPNARTLKFNVEKCALIEPKCEPVARVAGQSPEGDPVFCVDQEDGIQINCSAKGADEGVTYQWNWDQDPGPEQIQLLAREAGEFGATQQFVGRATAASDKPWTGSITVFVPDIGDGKTIARVPLRFRTARCPEMEDQRLPDAVVNENYVAVLATKAPIDARDVAFQLGDNVPSWMDLATTKGVVSITGLPDREGKVSFNLQVTEAATGAFSVVSMNLNVLKAAGIQPVLDIAKSLPTACAGQPYEAVIAEGAVAVSSAWDFTDNGGVPWLKVQRDPNSQRIVIGTQPGEVVPSGTVSRRVSVRALGGVLPKTADIDLPVMRSCKFAYATQSGDLKLGDLRQIEDPSLAPMDISSHISGYKVKAFFVSPNGRWVTHYGDSSVLVTRSIAGAGPGTEVRHVVNGTVEGGAWSPAGDAFAAVIRDTNGFRHLQVYVPSLAPPQGASAELVDLVDGNNVLTSGDAQSRPVWVGNIVCAPSFSFADLEFDSLLCRGFEPVQGLGSDGPVMLDIPDQGTSMRNPRSSFVTDETNLKVFSYIQESGTSSLVGSTEARGQMPDVYDDGLAVPDPTATWHAQPAVLISGSQFAVGIFPFGEKTKAVMAPRLISQCTEVRTWSSTGERLACTQNLASFYIAKVPRDGSALSIKKIDNAEMGAEVGLAFTPDAKWFVFFNGKTGYLSRVDIDSSELSPRALMVRENDVEVELKLAPTLMPFGREGTRLIASAGQKLLEIDAKSGEAELITSSISTVGPCDTFVQGMYRWCGSSTAAVSYSASPTGDGLVFPDAASKLVVAVRERGLDSWGTLTLADELIRPCDAIRGCSASLQFAEFGGKANAWR